MTSSWIAWPSGPDPPEIALQAVQPREMRSTGRPAGPRGAGVRSGEVPSGAGSPPRPNAMR